MSSKYIVGQEVRVDNASNTFSIRAMISFINDDGTVDVIYAQKSNAGQSKDEESGVPLSRVHELEPFELTKLDPKTVNGEMFKEYGNKLFAKKDFRSAMDMYRKALTALTNVTLNDQLSVGSIVLVALDKSIDYRVGMISDLDESRNQCTYDIMYDQNETGIDGDELESEESGVSKDRLTLVSSDVNDRSVQRAVYLNMARCYLKLNEPGWAIKTSSIALFITLYNLQHSRDCSGDTAAVIKQLVDAYYFRSKALLSVNRPGFATKDMNKLRQYDKIKAAQLDTEIKAHRTRMSKINKKLAKDVAKWVDTALSGINKDTEGGNRNERAGDDLAVTDDVEDEESSHRFIEDDQKQATLVSPSTTQKKSVISNEIFIKSGVLLAIILVCVSFIKMIH